MASHTIYTRAYSKSSAGQFVSAKWPRGDPLSSTALVEEFRNHANKWNREPTDLVSGSDRIVDTLKRAWAIPERYATRDARYDIAMQFKLQDPWDIGINLGLFAQRFGARVPLKWISYQLFYDCVRPKIVTDDVVKLRYANEDIGFVDFEFFRDLDDGIDTSLYDWWLSDIDFLSDYEEFKEWRNVIEDSITRDLIECWETWHDVDWDGTIIELSAKEEFL